ncbi:hypothetical protein [Rhizobium sp. H4]|uniref:hypothetical protein n=1 Tax=Rhizobium sp. H4 TaxID=2035449 RepID=UPI001FDEBC62|nr:hypothetical protein [Rhizobium sp. H4]
METMMYVAKAIKTADPEAFASIDLAAKVQTKNDPAAINAAIRNAGYPSSFRRLFQRGAPGKTAPPPKA